MKKLFLKSFALVAMLLCGLTASAVSGIDWSDTGYQWIGVDANADPTNNGSKYKIEKPEGLNVASIQLKGEKCAIYVSVPAGIKSATVKGVIEGAGMWMYLENFTAQETQVTIEHAQSSITFWVYYVDGVPSGESAETIKPTMTSASLVSESVTYNSVVINVAGTDKETEDGEDVAVTRFKVVYGETTNTYTATNGQITITGLTPGTTYSFTIYAVDAAGNVSEEGLKVEATTENRDSQCSGECGHFGNPTVKRIAYTIVYNPVTKAVEYHISALNGKKLDFMEVQTTKSSSRVDIPKGDSTSCTYSQTNVKEGDEIGIRFLYSTDEIGVANEMTAQNLTLSEPNIIYYKVGDCALAIEEDKEAPVLKSADLVSKTHNSAVIAVEATDNMGIASYKVVDEAKAFNANFAAVDGKITVTGLTPNTTYNFVISVIDLAGNESEEKKTVGVTTDTHFYEPNEAAPTPIQAADHVINVYSDKYNAKQKLDFADWGGGYEMTEKSIEGNNYSLFTYNNGNRNYFGLLLNPMVDASVKDARIHMDIWAEVNMEQVGIYPIWKVSEKGDNGTEVVVRVPLEGQKWNAIDLPLTQFVYAADGNKVEPIWNYIHQIKIDGIGTQIIALDNVYFWSENTTTQLEEQEVAPKVTKTIENGQLVIIRDGVKYNVVGSVIEK